jgi:hypothetical protein
MILAMLMDHPPSFKVDRVPALALVPVSSWRVVPRRQKVGKSVDGVEHGWKDDGFNNTAVEFVWKRERGISAGERWLVVLPRWRFGLVYKEKTPLRVLRAQRRLGETHSQKVLCALPRS